MGIKLKEIKPNLVIHCNTIKEVGILDLHTVEGDKAERIVKAPCYIRTGVIEIRNGEVGCKGYTNDLSSAKRIWNRSTFVEFSDLVEEVN